MTNSFNNPYGFQQSLRTPWFVFAFLFIIFYFGQPLDILWTISEKHNLDAYVDMIKKGSAPRQLALIALGVFSLIGLIFQKKHKLRLKGLLGWLMMCFLSLAILSISWADEPALSARRTLVLTILSLAALACAGRLSLKEVIAFAFWGCVTILIIGFCAEIVLGTFHPLEQGYRFAGTMHPNLEGWNCEVVFVTGLALALENVKKKGRWFFLAAAAIALGFLILTKSRTAMWSTVIATVVFVALVSPRMFGMVISVLMPIVAIVCLYAMFEEEGARYLKNLILLGRVEGAFSLMDRIPLWRELQRYIFVHPFLGYGYDSFWTEARLSTITSRQGWVFGSAHSGYFEMMLSLGLVGAVVYVGLFVIGIKRAIVLFKGSRKIEYAFASAILVAVCFQMLLESRPIQAGLSTFFYMVILAMLGFVEGSRSIVSPPVKIKN